MRQKKLTKTICFKTTPENYNYLKMFGNVNKKLNEFVTMFREYFELCQDELSLEIPLDEETKKES